VSNGGGITLSDVRSEIDRKLGPLERDIKILDQRLDQLERDMANVEGAVREMHRGLQGELNQLRSTNKELLDVQQQTKKITLEQFVEANTKLMTANAQIATTNNNLGVINDTSTRGFQTLDVGIDRMAQALVQTEVIRLLYEAKEPTERVKTFACEIEERFAKTVESVFMVRSQYDQLLGTAMNEYDAKLRVIGEHIYRVLEDDFQKAAETPLAMPSGRTVELPLALDDLRLTERRTALEARFDKLGDDLIEPLLEAHRSLEHTLASQFTAPIEASGEEIALPAALRIGVSGGVEVLGSVRVDVESAPSGQRRVNLKPVGEASTRAAIASRIEPVAARIKSVALTADQRETLKKTLERLGNEGRIDASLVGAYGHYLDMHGLEVVTKQEVKAQ